MPALKKRVRIYSDRKTRKKHVESMFLTNKQKKYPYYFKDRALRLRTESNKICYSPARFCYTVKVLDSGYVTISPLKAVMRLYKWFLKQQKLEKELKLILTKFPDFVLTSKPKEMRMGKGKGAPAKRVAILKSGAIFLVLRNRGGVSFYLIEQLLKMLSKKIPFKHKIIKNC